MNIEIERKFLIKRPDVSVLESIDGCAVREIVQTYLHTDGAERRIRRIVENGATSYIYTEKRRVPGAEISRFEDEREITAEEYAALYAEAANELAKTRYAFPYGGRVVEIDVYPDEIGGELFRGRAILEIEMESEDEELHIPEFIEVIEEVTGRKEYSNKSLAEKNKIGE